MPRFAFEKFPQADDRLTTQMKTVGEVMAIGRTFQESLQKALRGLEVGVDGFNLKSVDMEKIEDELAYPRAERLWYVADAFGVGMTPRGGPPLHEDRPLVPRADQGPRRHRARHREAPARATSPAEELRELKRKGFSDRRLAHLLEDERAPGARAPPRARHPPGLQARGHLRRRVRDQHGLPVLHLRRGVRGRARPTAGRSWCWAAGPTASARASSSTTAACTPRSPCARTATRPSWSTATRRPSPPTTTPPTACTSSR